MLEWLWPQAFWLAPLPLLMLLLPAAKTAQQAALRVPFFTELQQISGLGTAASRANWPALLLLALCWLGLIAAVARPEYVGEPVELPTTGRDLMLAVDISGSMSQEDMEVGGNTVPRDVVVKAVVQQFVEERAGDKVGLILFGSRAYVQAPLTFDTEIVKQLMSEAEIGFAGNNTAIGDAIGLAIKRLKDRPESSRVVILLTDGANTAGQVSPIQAARLAAKQKVKIYTVGIGAEEMLVRSMLGTRRVNPSRDLDEPTLMEIADLTGGSYYRARNTEELARIYQQIGELEPIEQSAESYRPRQSLLHWPLLAAGMALALLSLARSFGSRP